MLITDMGSLALHWVVAMSLAMARQIACVSFIPGFSRNNMTLLHRNAICLAVSLPQAMLISTQLQDRILSPATLAMMGFKEVVLGMLIGMLLAAPYWAFQSAFTLIDNQRGGNAAQLKNPSMDADASILGDMAERAFNIVVIQAGVFGLIFETIAQTYSSWPVLSPLPEMFFRDSAQAMALINGFLGFISNALVYASPVLLLLLLIEFGFAVSSTAAQGIPVYETAMPVKSLAAMFVAAVYFRALAGFAIDDTVTWWRSGIVDVLKLHWAAH